MKKRWVKGKYIECDDSEYWEAKIEQLDYAHANGIINDEYYNKTMNEYLTKWGECLCRDIEEYENQQE